MFSLFLIRYKLGSNKFLEKPQRNFLRNEKVSEKVSPKFLRELIITQIVMYVLVWRESLCGEKTFCVQTSQVSPSQFYELLLMYQCSSAISPYEASFQQENYPSWWCCQSLRSRRRSYFSGFPPAPTRQPTYLQFWELSHDSLTKKNILFKALTVLNPKKHAFPEFRRVECEATTTSRFDARIDLVSLY